MSGWQRSLRLALASVLSMLLLAGPAALTAQEPQLPAVLRLAGATFDPLAERLSQSEPTDSTWVVQFVGPVQEDWKAAVRATGAQLAFYLPDYAFLARMDAATAARVRALPAVRWVGPYRLAFRLSTAADEPPDASGRVAFTLQTFPGLDLAALVSAITALGGTVVGATDNGFAGYLRVLAPSSARSQLAALDGVVWVEPYQTPTVANERATVVLGAPTVRQELGLYGANQIVAVADSGLDTGTLATLHPDFQGRVLKAYCISRPDPCNWGDDNGHGTHVAGSVLGSGVASGADPASRRYAGSDAGMAPEAKLIVQAIGGVGAAIYAPLDVGDLLRQALRDGAAIQTNSWGSAAFGAYRLDAQQFDYALWSGQTGVVLVAAGNAGRDSRGRGRVDLGSLASPGTAKNVITVGASENNWPEVSLTYGELFGFPAAPIAPDRIANRIDGMAAFSSRGPTSDGRLKPDVVAPGTYVVSAFSRISPWVGARATTAYRPQSGTSMATPLVAGAAAIVREWLQTRRGITVPSGVLVKAVLLNGTDDIAPGQYGTDPAVQEVPFTRPNPVAGLGRVNLASSLGVAGTHQVWLADETIGLATGEHKSYRLTTNAPGPLRVLLAWYDYPGQPGTGRQLVNDLDLELVLPDGRVVPGNAGAYPVGDPCLRGTADACNSIETVILPAAPVGTYELRVNAWNVPQGGRQPFALAVSGQGVGSGPGQPSAPRRPDPPQRGSACPEQPLPGVYLYELPAFAGKCAFFTADSPSADTWHIGNDQAQSLRIRGEYTAIIWTDAGYSGRATPFRGPVEVADLAAYPCPVGACLGPKQASSIQVRYQGGPIEPPPPSGGVPQVPPLVLRPGNCDGNAGIYLYSEPNFGGKCTRVMLGDPEWFTGNANTWHIGNDAAQSLRFVPRGRPLDDGRFQPEMGFRVTLYQDVFFGGLWTTITGTLVALPDLATPPPGYHGPWIGTKTLSSIRLEIVQLSGESPLETSIAGGLSYRLWLPMTELGH
jgi:hypothetical protein